MDSSSSEAGSESGTKKPSSSSTNRRSSSGETTTAPSNGAGTAAPTSSASVTVVTSGGRKKRKRVKQLACVNRDQNFFETFTSTEKVCDEEEVRRGAVRDRSRNSNRDHYMIATLGHQGDEGSMFNPQFLPNFNDMVKCIAQYEAKNGRVRIPETIFAGKEEKEEEEEGVEEIYRWDSEGEKEGDRGFYQRRKNLRSCSDELVANYPQLRVCLEDEDALESQSECSTAELQIRSFLGNSDNDDVTDDRQSTASRYNLDRSTSRDNDNIMMMTMMMMIRDEPRN
ncbi:uncharacterized protein LOC124411801 [Diprion similis]|uniref:uncharacterized protein LOC124411801 n=1 Tax=Diprion similis TaxID=362088 RepID=UPI001EF8C61D|nr:uncharacterized protein LOC124411801 [Diprion similis]